jgi:hypothetical protein
MYDARDNRMFPVDEAVAKEGKSEGKAVFHIGDVVTLRGVDFVIFNVTDKNMILRVVKKNSVRNIA